MRIGTCEEMIAPTPPWANISSNWRVAVWCCCQVSGVRGVLGWRSRSAEPSAALKNQSGINGLLPSLAALGGPLHLFRLPLDLCSRFSKRVTITFPQEKSLDFPGWRLHKGQLAVW